jgi:LmbE family N-acetylglucosaminyl deacetylase
MRRITVLLTCCPLLLMLAVSAWAATAPTLPGPNDRYKTDILLIMPHSDEETGDVAGYLARAIFDQHRQVAVIITTRNNAETELGDNATGRELGEAMGAEREIEARRALAYLGIANVWFLNAPSFSGRNVLRSLEVWDHGSILGQVVRLIRVTRPEVILTWLPAYVAGANHSDHQAAGVIATEAFDAAGDPAAFGEQIAATPEGLHPWQPKKIRPGRPQPSGRTRLCRKSGGLEAESTVR